MKTEPWGRAHWDRLADGQWFDGMESWLAWLVDDPVILPDSSRRRGADRPGRAAQRARDRASELEADEAALAQALAETWGAVPAQDVARSRAEAESATRRRRSPGCTSPSTGYSRAAGRRS